MGTTRSVQPRIFRLIAEACESLNVQLVISLGNRFSPESFADFPGTPVVVKYAPQLDLLRTDQLVITHGGPNTVFEALMAGKPMIAIPLAYDQPAIAARLDRLQIAEVLPVMRLSSNLIREAIKKLLSEGRFHDSAVEMQSRLRLLHGTERAADLIEESLDRRTDQFPKARENWPISNCDPSSVNSDSVSSLQR